LSNLSQLTGRVNKKLKLYTDFALFFKITVSVRLASTNGWNQPMNINNTGQLSRISLSYR